MSHDCPALCKHGSPCSLPVEHGGRFHRVEVEGEVICTWPRGAWTP